MVPGIDPDISVGEFDRSTFPASTASALANPKSSTLTLPSGVIFTFAGLKSRCTTPFSCAASRASQILFAMLSASSIEKGPCFKRSARVSPSTSSSTK